MWYWTNFLGGDVKDQLCSFLNKNKITKFKITKIDYDYITIIYYIK